MGEKDDFYKCKIRTAGMTQVKTVQLVRKKLRLSFTKKRDYKKTTRISTKESPQQIFFRLNIPSR